MREDRREIRDLHAPGGAAGHYQVRRHRRNQPLLGPLDDGGLQIYKGWLADSLTSQGKTPGSP
jgi:hypothetical protein